jgi:hypothetical protein
VGDKVIPPRSEAVYEISRVYDDGEVDITFPNTNLQRFRVPISSLTFVDRRPSTLATAAKPKPDTGEVKSRIDNVRRGNFDRLNGDIGILAKYLKTEGVPKAAMNAETLKREQHESWEKAADGIAELLR